MRQIQFEAQAEDQLHKANHRQDMMHTEDRLFRHKLGTVDILVKVSKWMLENLLTLYN